MDVFPSNANWQPMLLYSWGNSHRTPKAALSSSSAQLTPGGAFMKKLVELVLSLIWNMLSLAGYPLKRMVATSVWLSISTRGLVKTVTHMLYNIIGWHLMPIKARWLRWILKIFPHAKRWHVTMVVTVLGGVVWHIGRVILRFFNMEARQREGLETKLTNAEDCEEWLAVGKKLDQLPSSGANGPNDDDLYDVSLLKETVIEFEKMRAAGDVKTLMFQLRGDIYRNFGNITNRRIHENRYVLPETIEIYVETVKSLLLYIAEEEDSGIPLEDKRVFFRDLRQAFGRTALVLSGGGALGSFHLGVVRALLQEKLLPRIIAGSSVGSIVAAIAAVHSDHELVHLYSNMESFKMDFFGHEKYAQIFASFLRTGVLQDVSFLIQRLRELLADTTFIEAYNRTGRILNVTVTSADTYEPPRLLNYLTAPDCVIWTAVAASSAFPGLFPPSDLMSKSQDGRFVKFMGRTDEAMDPKCGAAQFVERMYARTKVMKRNQRRWQDGSLENDLPVKNLSEMFNVNNFIVSQTNPHLVPLLSLQQIVGPRWFHVFETELKHHLVQAQNWFPTLMRWTRLFTQTWEGDVTIVLPWSMYQKLVAQTVVNPSNEELREADEEGKRSTWRHISAIKANCGIENQLSASLASICGKMGVDVNGYPIDKLGSNTVRVPSLIRNDDMELYNHERASSVYDSQWRADEHPSRRSSDSQQSRPGPSMPHRGNDIVNGIVSSSSDNIPTSPTESPTDGPTHRIPDSLHQGTEVQPAMFDWLHQTGASPLDADNAIESVALYAHQSSLARRLASNNVAASQAASSSAPPPPQQNNHINLLSTEFPHAVVLGDGSSSTPAWQSSQQSQQREIISPQDEESDVKGLECIDESAAILGSFVHHGSGTLAEPGRDSNTNGITQRKTASAFAMDVFAP